MIAPCSWPGTDASVAVLDLFAGTGTTMINNLVQLIQMISTLDVKLVALLVIALAIVAVIVIVNGLGR